MLVTISPMRVHPAVGARVAQSRVRVGIVAGVTRTRRRRGRNRARTSRAWAACPGAMSSNTRADGMPLGQIERAAGLQEERHDLGPAADVGQPVDRPPGDVDEVERRPARGSPPGRRKGRPRRSAPAWRGRARPPGRGAALIAGAEKSSPTTSAPRCARVSVSRPKWHCRCSTRSPADRPQLRLLDRMEAALSGTQGRRRRSWAPPDGSRTRSSQLARLTARQSSPSSATDPVLPAVSAAGSSGAPAGQRAASAASSSAMRACSGATAAATSASVKRGVMCCGQFQSNASTAITSPRSTLAR